MTDNPNNHDQSKPSIGPNEPVPSWEEYKQLKQALKNYLDHSPENPQWDDIWRALAAILGEYQRNAFIDAFNLAGPAESPCIRRLITGEEECQKSGQYSETPDGEPPHAPPASDHATLWLDDEGEPALYGMHVYPGNIERLDAEEPPHNLWFDVFEFAERWGLEVSVLPKSWYNIGTTVHIVFYPPERYRSPEV